MKQMTWEDYYDGFYDWAPSTQKSYTYRLSDFGPADEVWEIAQELSFNDNAFAAKFLEKAFAAGVRFTPDQVLEMIGTVEESVLSRMAEQTDVPFNREQLEEIYLMISDNSFQKISRRAHIDIFDDVKALQRQIRPRRSAALRKRKSVCYPHCLLFWQAYPWPVISRRSMMDTAMETVPTALPTTDIAMAAGTMGKAISTAVSLGATREADTCKRTTTASLYQRKDRQSYEALPVFLCYPLFIQKIGIS